MNILLVIIVVLPLFYLAYKKYASYISKIFEENDNNPTPAVSINDGVDYCPTKPIVLFGHHFASIAGSISTAGCFSVAYEQRKEILIYTDSGNFYDGNCNLLLNLFTAA